MQGERGIGWETAEKAGITVRRSGAPHPSGIPQAEQTLPRLEERLAERRGETWQFDMKVDTSHLNESRKPGQYWQRPTEMLARDFESYVNAKVADKKGESQYLVHGVEGDRYTDPNHYKGNPYPAGMEHEKINGAFDRLFEMLDTRQGDRGSELYMERRGKQEERPSAEQVDVYLAGKHNPRTHLVRGWPPNVLKMLSVRDLGSIRAC